MIFWYFITIITGCVSGAVLLIVMFNSGFLAPVQRLITAVLAIAFTIIPYCIAQAIEAIKKNNNAMEQIISIKKAIEKL
jgi:hypothetical protein